jgi:hypothetical protein
LLSENKYEEILQQSIKDFIGPKLRKQAYDFIPASYNDFQQLLRRVSSNETYKYWIDSSLKALVQLLAKHYGTTERSVEWIQNNGYCIENIIARPSTIDSAGRGAFVQYPIKQGEMIVPVPILHIVNSDASMPIYTTNGTNTNRRQLLENYCFGHHDSTVLLCPNTNAILINHCSKRQKHTPCTPNAVVRWANLLDDHGNTVRWLQMSYDDLTNQMGRGLAMEIVALQDLEVGDEVFIDYGEGWENEWDQHIRRWNQNKNQIMTRPSIHVLNENILHSPISLLHSGNLRAVQVHDTIETMCIYWPSDDDSEGKSELYHYSDIDFEPAGTRLDHIPWYKWSDAELLHLKSLDGHDYTKDFTIHEEGTYWPCSVLIQEDSEGRYYTVRIHYEGYDYDSTRTGGDQILFNIEPKVLLTRYPRESIRYFYRSYQSDIHWIGAFRHPIEIPDEIFPKQWKNRISNHSICS